MSRRRRRSAALLAVLVPVLVIGALALLRDVRPATTTPLSTAALAPADQGLVDAGLATVGADGTARIAADAVSRQLDGLTASTATGSTPYDRDAFGTAWADTDHNGCDTRNDILRRDLTAVTLNPGTHGCVVLTGTLHDPYTRTEITFTRGARTSTAVQIDHVWPLGLSWGHGASSWTPEQRQRFANDPTNLQAVDGSANESKSDSGPGQWLPENTATRCEYVARFVRIAVVYSLTIDPVDRGGIRAVLSHCTTP